MANTTNKVYVIIVNYKGYADTIECLESVLKSDYENFQIFLIDNSPDLVCLIHISELVGSNGYNNIVTDFKNLVYPLEDKPISHTIVDETDFKTLNATYKDKITVVKATNNGFAAANNIALKYIANNANEDTFIWILNNDTVIEKDTIRNLVDFYGYHDLNYIIGCKLMFYNSQNTLQAIAGSYNKWLGGHKHIGEGEIDDGQYDNFKFNNNDYIVGASMFLPKLFLNSVGLMSEEYFLYYEELDWVIRANRAGFKCAVQPSAIVYHKEGASITNNKQNKDTSLAEYYSITNRVRFIKKFYKWCLPTVLLGVIFALTRRLLKGKFALVKKSSKTVLQILTRA